MADPNVGLRQLRVFLDFPVQLRDNTMLNPINAFRSLGATGGAQINSHMVVET